MKRYFQSSLATLAFLFFATFALNAASIEGTWKSTKNNVQLQIEKTYTGIKTKRFDQDDWYFYDKVSKNKYEDYRGNQYQFYNDQELIWKSNSGNKKFRFYKTYITNSDYREYERERDRDRDRDRNRHYDDYDEHHNDHYADFDDRYGSCSYECRDQSHHHRHLNVERAFRPLRGTWYNQRNGTKMKIKLERSFIKVKTNHRWRVFYPSSRFTFSDTRGNHITVLSDGRLRIKNRNGYRSSLYSKRRPVSYCY